MFLTFLKILVWIRKQINLKTKKFFIVSTIGFVSSGLVAMIIDKIISVNFLYNFIRMIVSVIVGVSLFCVIYGIIIIRQSDDIAERKRLFQTFSFNQRVNISIFLFSTLITFHILSFPVGSAIYTFSTGLIITVTIFLFNFITPKSWEVNKFINGMEDERDFIEKKRSIKEK